MGPKQTLGKTVSYITLKCYIRLMPRRLPRVWSNHDVSLLLRLIRAHLQDDNAYYLQVDNAYYLQVDNVVIYRLTMLLFTG